MVKISDIEQLPKKGLAQSIRTKVKPRTYVYYSQVAITQSDEIIKMTAIVLKVV